MSLSQTLKIAWKLHKWYILTILLLIIMLQQRTNFLSIVVPMPSNSLLGSFSGLGLGLGVIAVPLGVILLFIPGFQIPGIIVLASGLLFGVSGVYGTIADTIGRIPLVGGLSTSVLLLALFLVIVWFLLKNPPRPQIRLTLPGGGS